MGKSSNVLLSVLTTLYGRKIEDCSDDRLKMPPLSQSVASPSVKDSCEQMARSVHALWDWLHSRLDDVFDDVIDTK